MSEVKVTRAKIVENYSIEEFKEMHSATELKVVRNPKNGKLFMTIKGAVVGAVSLKGMPQNPQIIETDESNGAPQYILCETNTDNVEAVL